MLALVGVGLLWLLLSCGLASAPSVTHEPLRAVTAQESSFGGEPIELSQLSQVVAPSAAPVASYTLNAELDPSSHIVRGTGTIRFRNHSQKSLSSLWLHLYLNAFADDETIFASKNSSGFRGNSGPFDHGSIELTSFRWAEGNSELAARARFPTPNDRTDVELPLPRPIAPGEEAHFELSFESKLPEIVLRTGYHDRFHMVAQWFPKLAKLETDGTFAHFPFERFSEFYADFGDYDVSLTMPEEFVVAAVGKEIERSVRDGKRTTRHVQASVIDFAFAAWDGFALETRSAGDVKLTCVFPRGQEKAARIQLEAAAAGLDYFGRAFGAYPYETLTLVHPPSGAGEAGGMEYPTLITTGAELDVRIPARILEILTLHELAHQWFMGLVATNEHASPFLDEGLTTYATGLAMDALYPDGVVPLLPFRVGVQAFERSFQLGAYAAAPVASSAGAFARGGDYGALVYQRTATILRTIDNVYDGAAQRAVARYAREQRFLHPGPKALVAAIRAEAGVEAGTFFSSAIFDKASLDYSIEVVPTDNQVSIKRNGELRLPTQLWALDSSGKSFVIEVPRDQLDEAILVPTDLPLVRVCVDPNQRLAVDEFRANDCAASDESSVAWRTLAFTDLALAATFGALTP